MALGNDIEKYVKMAKDQFPRKKENSTLLHTKSTYFIK